MAGSVAPARINVSDTSTATTGESAEEKQHGAIPADSVEKNSDSRITAPKSAIDAAATTS
jgi:hypothetical protein